MKMNNVFLSMLAVAMMMFTSCSDDKDENPAPATSTTSAKASAKPASVLPKIAGSSSGTTISGGAVTTKAPLEAISSTPQVYATIAELTAQIRTTDGGESEPSSWYFDGNVYNLSIDENGELDYEIDTNNDASEISGGFVFYMDGVVANYNDSENAWNWGNWYVGVENEITYLTIDDLEGTVSTFIVDEIEEDGEKYIYMATQLAGNWQAIEIVESSIE